MLCFENAAGRVVSHQTYVQLLWNTGQRQDEDIMQVLDKILEIGQELNIDRLLVDQEIMNSCSVEVEVWFKYDWLTRARLQFDYGAAAILSGRNLLVRLATTGMLRHLLGWAGAFQIRVFPAGQEQEAIEWLSQRKPEA
jgi:hypothetical protein